MEKITLEEMRHSHRESGVVVFFGASLDWLRDKYAHEFGNIDLDQVAILPVADTYSYGFDVHVLNGGRIELCCEDEEQEIVYIPGNDTIDLLALMELVNVEPKAPVVDKESLEVLPDVSKVDTDTLIRVVGTYQDIHSAAVSEVNSRLKPINHLLSESD